MLLSGGSSEEPGLPGDEMAERAISDSDLHAYVDGWLDPARRLEVERYLASDREAAARVLAYRAQNDALHSMFDPLLEQPTDGRIAALGVNLAGRLAAAERRRSVSAWKRVAAAAALLLVGAAGGWLARDGGFHYAGGHPPLQEFAREAVQAHAFYAGSRFAVEMGADDPGALDGWLSHRLGRTVSAPDLTAVGYALMGGRSLPTSTGPGVQYMYESGKGRRLTLFVSIPEGGQSAAFSYVRKDDISIFYWQEGVLAYALIGRMDRDELMEVAQAAYGDRRPAGSARASALQPAGHSSSEAAVQPAQGSAGRVSSSATVTADPLVETERPGEKATPAGGLAAERM